MVCNTDNPAVVDEKRLNLNKTKVDVAKLIKKCVERFCSISLNKPQIDVVVLGRLPKIVVDENEIELLFMVILAEILKLVGNEMLIVTISNKKMYAEFNVSCSTMNSKASSSLFDGDGSESSLCKHITWAHGGIISIDSVPCVTFYLPINPDAP